MFGEGTALHTQNGTEIRSDTLPHTPVIGLLFADPSAPKSSAFITCIERLYTALNAHNKQLEVVLCGGGKTQKEYRKYAQKQPWMSIPYSAGALCDDMRKKFNVANEPALVLVSGDGIVMDVKGEDVLQHDPLGTSIYTQTHTEKNREIRAVIEIHFSMCVPVSVLTIFFVQENSSPGPHFKRHSLSPFATSPKLF